MLNRRQFLKIGGTAGLGILFPWKFGAQKVYGATIPGGTLDPGSIPPFLTPLVIPPAMPRTTKLKTKGSKNIDYFEIAVRQFQQNILPDEMGLPTTVWSYGSANHAGTFNYPAFTIEAKWNRAVQVKWVNDLKDANGNFLPHILPVDQTLHWANPPGGPNGRDSHGMDPSPYDGPVPLVTHVHGAHSSDWADGYAEAWYLPDAVNIPAGYAKVGSFYDIFKTKSPIGADWTSGSAVFQYSNDQRASTLWYHDHSLGMTRLNVYAGPAGFYILRGGPSDFVLDSRYGTPAILPGPGPALGDPAGLNYYEIPIAIQDRSFNEDGSLFYPDNRAFFEGLGQPPTSPYLDIPFRQSIACDQDSDVAPIWNPEFFGNTIVVNGKTWPFLNVEQRRYRFRLLNGCNSRFLILKFEHPGVEVWQIGAEGGFLAAPVPIDAIDVGGLGGILLMGLAERADVIVDFTNVPAGTSFRLLNLGPDEPFGGFPTSESDSNTTGQIMEFRVVPATSVDTSTPPMFLQLPAIPSIVAATTRQLSLNEEESISVEVKTDGNGNVVLACGDEEASHFGPIAALMGTVDNGMAHALGWAEDITEKPAVGSTETWEFYNFTEDAHPIHIHLVQFQVVDREGFEIDEGGAARPTGSPRGPESWETGYKDTVISYPGEITRVQAQFDKAGLYVWHCHIVEHEDNEMMRPFLVE